MYEYMVKAEVLSETAPFKVLNCAQYYNNPELLSGLLFGYSKEPSLVPTKRSAGY